MWKKILELIAKHGEYFGGSVSNRLGRSLNLTDLKINPEVGRKLHEQIGHHITDSDRLGPVFTEKNTDLIQYIQEYISKLTDPKQVDNQILPLTHQTGNELFQQYSSPIFPKYYLDEN